RQAARGGARRAGARLLAHASAGGAAARDHAGSGCRSRDSRSPAQPMSTTVPSLPYAFAKRHGVVVLDGAGEAIQIGLREDATATALIEVRRALGRPLQVAQLPRAAFDRKLSEVYADAGLGTSEAVDQLDMHGSLDSLVEDIPATADLLESQDDAPIIRLINGLIAEGA